MDFYNYINNNNQLWESCSHTNCNSINVSEIWQGPSDQPQDVRHENIPGKDIEHWLGKTSKDINGLAYSLVLRLVWVKYTHKERQSDITSDTQDQIIKAFDINIAYHYNKTSFAGSAHIPQHQTPAGEVSSYSFSIHPKLAIAWSQNVATNLTQGLCHASSQQISTMRVLLGSQKALVDQSMLVAFICGAMLGGEVDRGQDAIKTSVREVEVRTGYHSWKSRVEDAAKGDLGSLSAQMSGCATKLASISRKIKVIQELNDFILEELNDASAKANNSTPQRLENNNILKKHVLLLNKRAKMQQIDTDFFQQRTQIQLSALFNLTAQNDALVGIEVAQDSKLLAVASQRDSSSMKTLAVVTMFFLPGTFVASLFAMPLFDWDADGTPSSEVIKPRFGIYWAVTLPLTVVTFIIWGCWTLLQGLLHRRQDKDAKDQLSQNLTEVGVVATRRAYTMHEEKHKS